MSTELIAIISVGVALAGLMLNGQHTQRVEIQTLSTVIQDTHKFKQQADGF